MSEESGARIKQLEQDNARLRRLLAARNVPATLRHQVKGTLGLLRAILRRSAEVSASVEEYAAHVEGRFDALLRVQNMLIGAAEERVALDVLIANELLAHVIRDGEEASLTGPHVLLGPNGVQVLGLALHELATNAIKFGAMTASSGRIAVRWSVSGEAEPKLLIEWAESGLSLAARPSFRGFGMETLEDMLRYELGAESDLEFRSEGLRWAIRVPLQRVQR